MTEESLGTDSQGGPQRVPMSSRTVAGWLWPFSIGGVALFSISALFYYHFHRLELRPDGLLQQAIAALYSTFGWAPSVVFFLLVFAWSLIWFVTGVLERPVSRLARLVVLSVMLGVFLNLGNGGVVAEPHKGAFGAWLAGRLVSGLGYVPSLVVVWLTTFASLLLATDWFFSEWFERPRAEPEDESGVEEAVADQLRALGQDTPPAALAAGGEVDAAAAVDDAPAAAGAPEPGRSEGPPVVGEDVDPDAGEAANASSRRESYADRRRMRSEVSALTESSPAAATEAAATSPAARGGDGEAGEASVADEKALSEQELAALFDASTQSAGEFAADEQDSVVLAPEYIEADEVVLSDMDAPASAGQREPSAADAFDDGEAMDRDQETVKPAVEVEVEDAGEESAEIAVEGGLEEVGGDLAEDDDECEYEDESDEEAAYEDESDEESDEEAAYEDEYEDESDEEAAYEDESDEESDEEAGYEDESDEESDEESLYEDESDEETGEEAIYEAEPDEEALSEGAEAGESEEFEAEGDDADADEAFEVEGATEEFEVSLDERAPDEVGDIVEDVAAEEPDVVAADRSVGAAEDAAAIAIPRPDNAAEPRVPTPPAMSAERDPGRQQNLFGGGLDEQLIEEARELLVRGRRPSASMLQRKLRIDYELAQDLLRELSNRGLMGTDS